MWYNDTNVLADLITHGFGELRLSKTPELAHQETIIMVKPFPTEAPNEFIARLDQMMHPGDGVVITVKQHRLDLARIVRPNQPPDNGEPRRKRAKTE